LAFFYPLAEVEATARVATIVSEEAEDSAITKS
jgi:hypothetical protein